MSQHGTVHGGPKRNAPSWGAFPEGWDGASLTQSMVSTGPSGPSTGTEYSSGIYGTQAAPQSQYSDYPAEFTEARDPVQEAKDKKKKLERRDRRGKRKRNDAKTAAETLLYLGVWNVIMWTIPILGGAWHKRMFAGFGIGFTQMQTSLFTMTFSVECHQMAWPFGLDDSKFKELSPEHQVCKILDKMTGTHSLHAARDMACAITHISPSSQSCSLMETVLYGSYFLIFGYAISALLSFIATMFLYYYWYEEHLAQIRNWAMALYVMSPVTGMMSFLIYTLIMPDLGELPRAWTSMVQSFNAGTGLGEIHAIGDDVFWVKYGWTWFFSYITFAFAMAAPVVWGVFFKKHEDEKVHERAAEKEIQAIEDAVVELEEKQDYVETGNMDMYAGKQLTSGYPGSQYDASMSGAESSAGYGSQGGYGAYDARAGGASAASWQGGYGAYDGRAGGASVASSQGGYGAYEARGNPSQGAYGAYGGGYGSQVAPTQY